MIDVAGVHETLSSVARPRMTGSDGARETAATIRRRFRDLGYDGRDLPFSFSTLPGRYGLPVAGAILMATAIAAGGLLPTGHPVPALVALVVGLALAGLPLILLDAAIHGLPWGRVETANMLFIRGTPRWIVMAHRDTKSQLAPTAVRTVALVAAVLGWLALVTLAGLSAVGLPSPGSPEGVAGVADVVRGGAGSGWVGAAAAVLAGSGLVLLLSPAGNRSPGALDNASGLAALLALAERTPPEVAFLVTDGEELGLAGARAVADRLPEGDGIINLDGLDDAGPIRIAESRDAGTDGPATLLATALLETARSMGMPAVRRPLPPFVMVDHEPLARAGLPALTVLKGSWRSLLRVHRPGDTPDRITGGGAAEVATLVLATLGESTEDPDATLRPGEQSGHSPPP